MSELVDCKPYLKSLDKDGYSLLYRGSKGAQKKFRAHKYFYEQKYGKVNSPLDHLCRNKWCINIDHLEPVTIAENTRRGLSAKLDYTKIKIIKNMYMTGKYRQYELADLFSVCQGQISRIINRKRWGIM